MRCVEAGLCCTPSSRRSARTVEQ